MPPPISVCRCCCLFKEAGRSLEKAEKSRPRTSGFRQLGGTGTCAEHPRPQPFWTAGRLDGWTPTPPQSPEVRRPGVWGLPGTRWARVSLRAPATEAQLLHLKHRFCFLGSSLPDLTLLRVLQAVGSPSLSSACCLAVHTRFTALFNAPVPNTVCVGTIMNPFYR